VEGSGSSLIWVIVLAFGCVTEEKGKNLVTIASLRAETWTWDFLNQIRRETHLIAAFIVKISWKIFCINPLLLGEPRKSRITRLCFIWNPSFLNMLNMFTYLKHFKLSCSVLFITWLAVSSSRFRLSVMVNCHWISVTILYRFTEQQNCWSFSMTKTWRGFLDYTRKHGAFELMIM
jgi:hypothetical protein